MKSSRIRVFRKLVSRLLLNDQQESRLRASGPFLKFLNLNTGRGRTLPASWVALNLNITYTSTKITLPFACYRSSFSFYSKVSRAVNLRVRLRKTGVLDRSLMPGIALAKRTLDCEAERVQLFSTAIQHAFL